MSNPNEPTPQTNIWEIEAQMVHEKHTNALRSLAKDVEDRKHRIDECVHRLLAAQRDTNRVHDVLTYARQQLEDRQYERVQCNITDSTWVMYTMTMRMASVANDLTEVPWNQRLAEKIASITEDSPVQKEADKPASLRLPDWGPDFHKSQCGI